MKDADAAAYAAGVEAGSRMALGEGLTVAPRAGLSWSKIDLKDFTDEFGTRARVSVKDARSTKGRSGVMVEREAGFGETSGRLLGSLDVERELSDETEWSSPGTRSGRRSARRPCASGWAGCSA